MAHYDDFDGVYFTLQALRAYHDLSDVELLLVDNKPIIKRDGNRENNVIESFMKGNISNSRYIKSDDTAGTSSPRDLIFREANSKSVMCIDCHVLLIPGAIKRLIDWYDRNPDNKDLLTGPLITDNLHDWYTHFDLRWRGGMWGTWGLAWTCECGQHFTVQDDKGKAAFHDLMDFSCLGNNCTCGKQFPDINYASHEGPLFLAGYRQLAKSRDDQPFEIPAQGLGLFSCNKDAWLGFNENFRGFGGEEGYIHIKYRQSGHRCLNLPFLGWIHRFGRVDGVKYPCTYYDRVRNYVIGHNELNLSTDDIYKHFCTEYVDKDGQKGKGINKKDWDYLVTNPIENISVLPNGSSKNMTLEQIFDWTKKQPRDMEEHMDRFRDIASKCNHIVAIVKRKEWDVTLLAGKPKTLLVYTSEPDSIHNMLRTASKARNINYRSISSTFSDIIDIEETDMLVLHTIHNEKSLYTELTMFAPKVRHYILIRSTGVFGSRGEDGSAGMFQALQRYLNENAKWFVVEHSDKQWGYTLLSCAQNEKDKRMLPSLGLW